MTCTEDASLGKIGRMKPHITCYTERNVRNDMPQGSDKSSSSVFGYAELFVDISPDPSQDAFVDPPQEANRAARKSHDFFPDPSYLKEERILPSETFGQHISYVVETFARQPRVFLFTIRMSGSRARLFHWDRSGCVVSGSFDIREQPEILCEVLWRFSHTTNAGRGHDMSVSVSLPGGEEFFREKITNHVREQLGPGEDLDKAVTQHYQPGRVFAATVLYQGFTAKVENTRHFLFSRPVVTPLSLTGRGTRGYWAIDTSTGDVVFLKDTWRHDSVTEVEGLTLRRLCDQGVRYVPSMIWHGDIPNRLPGMSCKLVGESPVAFR